MKNMMVAVMSLALMLSVPSVWADKNIDNEVEDITAEDYDKFSQCTISFDEEGNVLELHDTSCELEWLQRQSSKEGKSSRWWLTMSTNDNEMLSENKEQLNLHLKLASKCLYQLDGHGKWHKCSILINTEDKIVLEGGHKRFGFKLDIKKIPNVRRNGFWSLTYIFAAYWFYG